MQVVSFIVTFYSIYDGFKIYADPNNISMEVSSMVWPLTTHMNNHVWHFVLSMLILKMTHKICEGCDKYKNDMSLFDQTRMNYGKHA